MWQSICKLSLCGDRANTSVICQNGHGHANTVCSGSIDRRLTCFQQLGSAHSLCIAHPYTHPWCVFVSVRESQCVCVIYSQLSQRRGPWPAWRPTPHRAWVSLSLTWDLQEEVTKEIAEHKEIKYGKRSRMQWNRFKIDMNAQNQQIRVQKHNVEVLHPSDCSLPWANTYCVWLMIKDLIGRT